MQGMKMRHGMESSMLYSAEDTQATTCCNVTGKKVVARRLVTMSHENKSSPDDLLLSQNSVLVLFIFFVASFIRGESGFLGTTRDLNQKGITNKCGSRNNKMRRNTGE